MRRMPHSLSSGALSFVCASILWLAGCSPTDRDFQDAGTGGADVGSQGGGGDSAQGTGGVGTNDGGAGGHIVGVCVPDERQCLDNRPQRCNDDGQWEDAESCRAEAPVCSRGACQPPPSHERDDVRESVKPSQIGPVAQGTFISAFCSACTRPSVQNLQLSP
jgi:hypothetical protein